MDSRSGRLPTFRIKAGAGLSLSLFAGWLLFDVDAGAVLGGWRATLLAVALILTPAIIKTRLGMAATLGALLFAGLAIESPGPLSFVFFYGLIFVAVFSPRASTTDHAGVWLKRLAGIPAIAVIGPIRDGRSLLRLQGLDSSSAPLAVVRTMALPVIGGLLFLGLFALANPVLSLMMSRLALPPLDVPRVLHWGASLALAWMILRPRRLRRPGRPPLLPLLRVKVDAAPPNLMLSLLVFNAVFALQNGLDIAFLWSGAALPAGVTLADYAHRGAYTLILTALLAGVFVLVALQPGSRSAGVPLVRRLVMLWVLQNLLLVASSALRTADYIEVYSLTPLRIAALAWMALVAAGLVLTLWRILRAKSASWLINANALTTGAVLAICAVVDLSAVSAAWNVSHARDTGGTGALLDVCYLERLGEPALVSLARLERRHLEPDLALRVSHVRRELQHRLEIGQADWRRWTLRGARRLEAAQLIAPPIPPSSPRGACRGVAATVPAPPEPLTAPAQQ